jgi:hypothetical protein
MMRAGFYYHCAECHCAERRHAECRGAVSGACLGSFECPILLTKHVAHYKAICSKVKTKEGITLIAEFKLFFLSFLFLIFAASAFSNSPPPARVPAHLAD